MITVTTFGHVPDFAKGFVRDLPVRWALEEQGLPYGTRLIEAPVPEGAPYRTLQPFGQVPVYEEDGLSLFESGAIVLHVARHGTALLPPDEPGRARAVMWMFAALNSVEPAIMPFEELTLFARGAAWEEARRPEVEARARRRLAELARHMAGRRHLENRFTAGDLMMVSVLRSARPIGLLEGEPELAAYVASCEARPAFQRALRDHLDVFAA